MRSIKARALTKHLLAIIFLLLSLERAAAVSLPRLFGDHMVLQRNQSVPVWGWADPGEEVAVQFGDKRFTVTTGPEKTWKITLPPMPAGGPYTLTVAGKNQIIFTDILVGDVWICGGQSNMQYQMGWLGNRYDAEVAQAANPQIRLMTVSGNTSTVPLDDIQTDGWKQATPAAVLNFSAVGYFFGKDLYDQHQVPIGLISSNMGATPAEAWTSAQGLREFPHYTKRLEEVKEAEALHKVSLKAREDRTKLLYAQEDTAATLAADISGWKTIHLPGRWNQTLAPDSEAVVWFAREFDLPAGGNGQDFTLFTGRIDDNDIAYVNGHRVGGMGEYKNYHVPRAYRVSRAYLKPGKNRMMIRVNDRWLNGGLTGPAGSMRVEEAGTTISLTGLWHYKVSAKFQLSPKPSFDYSIRTPAVLFNAMIHPLIRFPVKGAIWYQGEGNTSIAWEYRKLFPALITDWRSRWGIGDFPFLFVQLANYLEPDKEPQESEWAELREAQSVALQLPNTGMAVTIDIGEAADIHPRNKKDTGYRLALAARKVAYGEDVVYAGPMYASMQTDGNKIRLRFTQTGSGLVAKGGAPGGFAVAGKEGKFVWANARIEGNTVVVWHDKIKSPRSVRYAWADNPDKANLYNREGLPAAPFRTDMWLLSTQKKAE